MAQAPRGNTGTMAVRNHCHGASVAAIHGNCAPTGRRNSGGTRRGGARRPRRAVPRALRQGPRRAGIGPGRPTPGAGGGRRRSWTRTSAACRWAG